MGICLDTEQSDGSQAFEEGQDTWTQNSARDQRNLATPPEGQFPMHNNTNVQFESPKAPVIFVLGGPGSGKVTHCDNLMQEKQGIIHINMTDLLQQYAIGNDMQDFSTLSSKTVTEVLMLEMKMAPGAKTYLISGYPRNMRDVVEYSEKIQSINGVILISWRQKVLERQIDYGAKLGQVVLSLARMELNNFYKNVMPVADYFDQSNMLIAVNGERHPGDVYKDFRSAVIRILGMQDNPPIFSNGKAASVPNDVTVELPTMPSTKVAKPEKLIQAPKPQLINVNSNTNTNNNTSQVTSPSPVMPNWPPVLWIIGGPGSNKANLCTQAARETGWIHISLGKLLRAAAEPIDNKKPNNEVLKIRESVSNGELVPLDIIMKIVESHMAANITAIGVILDGFPRDMEQIAAFEEKFKQKPTIILLDCSKLQLGRGRLDDSVTAFRRRLEIFREHSLPMLKAMDNIGRLTIVDGDTDTAPVQEDFKNVVKEHIDYIKDNTPRTAPLNNGGNLVSNGNLVGNGRIQERDMTVQDLESETLNTISQQVQHNMMTNGVNHMGTNGNNQISNGHGPPKLKNAVTNGLLSKYASLDAERQENIRNIYNNEIQVESHM